jgi:quinol monooxygenase YgiN
MSASSAGKTLHVIARIVARPDTIDEVKAIAVSMIAPTHREPGCLKYELYQNDEDPTDFTFVEEWTDGAALDAHAAAPHIAGRQPRLREITAVPTDVRKYSHVKPA